MEVYYQSRTTLKLYLGQDADLVTGVYQVFLTITRLSDGVVLVNDQAATRDSTGIYSYVLSESQTTNLGAYERKWRYVIGGTTRYLTQYMEIVVGYTTPIEVKSEYAELSSKTDDEIRRKERLARKMIDTFCSQTFDFELATIKKIEGQNKDTLRMPRRLFTFTSIKIDGTEDITSTVDQKSEFYLEPKVTASISIPDIKRDIFGSPYFKKKTFYHVTGNWGYKYVPVEINRAAMMLVRDYFEDSNLLRQHGVIASEMGDTSFKFKSHLWATTGNYDVDLLLSPHRYTNFTIL